MLKQIQRWYRNVVGQWQVQRAATSVQSLMPSSSGSQITMSDSDEDQDEEELELVDSGSYECFLSGMSLEEYQANSLFQRYRRLKSMGRTDEAREHLRQILREHPNSKPARLIRRKMGRSDESGQ